MQSCVDKGGYTKLARSEIDEAIVCPHAVIDRWYGLCYLISMQTSSRFRIITALFACMMLTCAVAAIPLVHKHFPSHQAAANEQDASCSWVKTEKNYRDSSIQQFLAFTPLLLFFVALIVITFHRTEDPVFLSDPCKISCRITRAPPAC